jgi:hypothetical protein
VDPREGQETIGTDLHVFSKTSEDIQDLATDSLATDSLAINTPLIH